MSESLFYTMGIVGKPSNDGMIYKNEQISNHHPLHVQANDTGSRWIPTHGLVQEDHSDPEARKSFVTGSNHYLVLPVSLSFHHLRPSTQAFEIAKALEQHAEEMEAAAQQAEPYSDEFIAKHTPWAQRELATGPPGTRRLVSTYTPPEYSTSSETECLICQRKNCEWRKTPCGHVFC